MKIKNYLVEYGIFPITIGIKYFNTYNQARKFFNNMKNNYSSVTLKIYKKDHWLTLHY